MHTNLAKIQYNAFALNFVANSQLSYENDSFGHFQIPFSGCKIENLPLKKKSGRRILKE